MLLFFFLAHLWCAYKRRLHSTLPSRKFSLGTYCFGGFALALRVLCHRGIGLILQNQFFTVVRGGHAGLST